MQARFCILRQKYIEALEQGDVQMALHTLRAELAPLQVNSAEVRMLSGVPCMAVHWPSCLLSVPASTGNTGSALPQASAAALLPPGFCA